MTSDLWQTIKKRPQSTLNALFEGDGDRAKNFSLEQAGIYFDFSKTHLDQATVQAFRNLADDVELPAKTNALLSGEAVNVSEGRAAEHCAERGMGSPASVENAHALHQRMKSLIEIIDSGALGEFTQIIHLGIGEY